MYLLHNALLFVLMLMSYSRNVAGIRQFSKDKILQLREEVRAMFQFAYDGYLRHAADYDELRPLTCDGVNTWGSYSLTLIDALDTLATMGNYTEFRRVAKLLETKMNFDRDINVSVFETNIRIVGGLLGAHLLSKRAGVTLEAGWPCNGPLLRMATDVARRLLPAFDTATGMPYGTVNLRNGVPRGETSVTCTAGVGTFLVEFGTLSRLTGDSIFEDVAINAIQSLWQHRSAIGLFGNHIDVQTGRWTAQDAGIGAGVDSFFEYLVKGAILLNRPSLLEMFHEARAAIDKYLKRDDWYIWAGMYKGQVTLPVFQSLEAFWPGVLSMIGDIKPAMRTLSRYNSVWKQYGFLPEFYNIPAAAATLNRESFPLRPELAESAMYLYRATRNPFLLEVGENMLRSIEHSARTECGYATIRNVLTHEQENRMESFFLAETTKYLYLLFDPDNFLHNDGAHGVRWPLPHGECVIEAGAYIFNTEAHPVDLSALYCCHDLREDIFEDFDAEAEFNEAFIAAELAESAQAQLQNARKYECNQGAGADSNYDKLNNTTNASKKYSNISIDIEVFDEHEAPAAAELIENFEKVRMARETQRDATQLMSSQLTVTDLQEFFSTKRATFESATHVLDYVVEFMQRHTLEPAQVQGLQLFAQRITANFVSVEKDLDGKSKTLWQLFQLQNKYAVNTALIETLGLHTFDYESPQLLDDVLQALENIKVAAGYEAPTAIETQLLAGDISYRQALVNTTAMQEFLLKILINGTTDKNRSFNALLSDEEIMALRAANAMDAHAVAEHNIFENLQRVLKFKKRLLQTFQKLQSVVAKDGSAAQQSSTSSSTSETSKETAAVAAAAPETTDSAAASQAPTTPQHKSDDDAESSIWSQLVQSILRTTKSTLRTKFDEKLLLEKTRISLSKYAQQPQNYSLFSCPAQSFISRFAFREFYP